MVSPIPIMPVKVSRIQNRRGTQADFEAMYAHSSIAGATEFDVLLPGELALCTDSRRVYMGLQAGEYIELGTKLLPGGDLHLTPTHIQLPPSSEFVDIPALSHRATTFYSLSYSLSDSYSSDWSIAGRSYSRTGELRITSTAHATSMVDTGVEVGASHNLVFRTIISDGIIYVQYKNLSDDTLMFTYYTTVWTPYTQENIVPPVPIPDSYSYTISPSNGSHVHTPGELKIFTAVRTPPSNGIVAYYIDTNTMDTDHFIGFSPGLVAGATLINGHSTLAVELSADTPLSGMYRIRMIGRDTEGNIANYYSDYIVVG